jgi:hypothetical protein
MVNEQGSQNPLSKKKASAWRKIAKSEKKKNRE